MCKNLKLKASAFVLFAGFLVPNAALATSISEYDAIKSADQRALFVRNMVEKAANSVQSSRPKLAQSIRDYFFITPPSSRGDAPEGMIDFYTELTAYRALAHKGLSDLSKVQIESIVMDIIKEKIIKPGSKPAS